MLKQWRELIALYLEGTCGALLGGIVHNLNNHVHSFKLQSELFAQKLDSGKVDCNQQTKSFVQRINSGASELSSFSHQLERRTYFFTPEQLEINLSDFFNWFNSFWINHLFFKHQIELKIALDENLPYFIQVPAQYFTFCLEEGLKNAIAACQGKSQHPDGQNYFILDLRIQGKNEKQLEITLSSPTTIVSDLDPWAEGSTTLPGHLGMGLPLVRRICDELGWSCSLQSKGENTVYTVIISNPT